MIVPCLSEHQLLINEAVAQCCCLVAGRLRVYTANIDTVQVGCTSSRSSTRTARLKYAVHGYAGAPAAMGAC